MTTDTPARDPAEPLDLWAARAAYSEHSERSDDAAIYLRLENIARLAVQLALAVRDSEHAAQDAKVAGLVQALLPVFMYLDPGEGLSPGHGHQVPGVWDDEHGNRDVGRVGVCKWCAQWNSLRAALATYRETTND